MKGNVENSPAFSSGVENDAKAVASPRPHSLGGHSFSVIQGLYSLLPGCQAHFGRGLEFWSFWAVNHRPVENSKVWVCWPTIVTFLLKSGHVDSLGKGVTCRPRLSTFSDTLRFNLEIFMPQTPVL